MKQIRYFQAIILIKFQEDFRIENPNANFHNPKTGQSLRPDLNHGPPIGHHWDWKDSSGIWWRLHRFNRFIKP